MAMLLMLPLIGGMLFFLPMLASTWKGLLWIAALVGGPILFAQAQHGMATARPGYDYGPLGNVSVAFADLLSVVFLAGVLVRAIMIGYNRSRTPDTEPLDPGSR